MIVEFCETCPQCISLREDKELRRCIYCLQYPASGWQCRPCGNWPCTCTEYLLEDR